jgi:hypothetical protein
MAKKSTRKKLIEKLDKVFSQYIRLREAKNNNSECFTCGKVDHWKRLQNGHFMSRKHLSTRWDETNCQVQCAGCNVFRYGEQYKFSIGLDAKYGKGTAESMLLKSKETLKIDNIELEAKIKYYQDLVERLL